MRIVVNDIAASSGGVLTVLKDFYEFVKENDKENEWFFLVGDDYIQPSENIHVIKLPEIKKSYIKRLIFDFITGKKLIKKLNADCIFSLQNTVIHGVKIPQTVYQHQPLPFQDIKNYSFFKKDERKLAVYQHLIGKIIFLSAKKADKLIVQTEWMREAICEKCSVSKEKIVKIAPNIENSDSMRVAVERKNNIFFFPTSNMPYKNISCIYEACKLLESKNLDFTVKITVPDGNPQKNIEYIGQIPRNEVFANLCEGTLIFPSYIETFGYPLIEAAQMGAIVLAADCPYAHEVIGDYENTYYFDPFKPEQLAVLMEKIITGDIQHRDVFKKMDSVENTWQKVVEEVISAKKE
ncbi:MAG: glycosyltransferase [Clostridia bacterium]|nr:glycosyltransferase [Clostridia bacterium]